jgi:peptide deformylase
MTLPIVLFPNQVLTQPAKTVTKFNKKLEKLVSEMKKSLLATTKPKGVGLAAPQIGEPYRLFITRPHAKADIRVFVNPEIIAFSESQTPETEDDEDKPLEGCLSIPNVWGHVTRASNITLRYQDMRGETHEELIDGYMATIVQHETDHTNGILFSQRVIEQQEKFFQTVIDEEGKEQLEEIRIP